MTVSYNNQFTTLGTPLNRVIYVDYLTPAIAMKHYNKQYCTIQRTASDIANNRADDGGWYLCDRTAVGLRGQRRILLTERKIADGSSATGQLLASANSVGYC
jgi:hypothetical protein